MAHGHISIHRAILSHHLWDKNKKTKFEAWIYILMRASWRPKKIVFGYQVVHVERGEFVTSQKELCEALRWSRESVRSLLKLLVSDEMISLETKPRYSVITICKYDTYQLKIGENLPLFNTKPNIGKSRSYKKAPPDNHQRVMALVPEDGQHEIAIPSASESGDYNRIPLETTKKQPTQQAHYQIIRRN